MSSVVSFSNAQNNVWPTQVLQIQKQPHNNIMVPNQL